MIAVGETAPEFEAPDSAGRTLRLSSLRGKKVLLYFFPKALTAGCAAETRQFGVLAPALAEQGILVLGISVDTAETQSRFAVSCKATFPLLSDVSKSIARSYGVLSVLGVAKRVSFLIDEEGIVRGTKSSVLPGPHLDWAEGLRDRGSPPRAG
ncbi:MAG TPA: peroxiredoxin [Thermoplasmata archaeon]|nr:peroxiredoxin [Thermoplasmata archaeon]